MSKISNRFFVTAIDDGITLHGSLSSDKTLTQAWTGSAVTPDWTKEENQPTIYLTLYSGSNTAISNNVKDNYEWYNDGQPITFNSDGISDDGIFKKTTTKNNMPALKIIGNMRSNVNTVDTNTITLVGQYDAGSNSLLDFSASIQTRISVMNQGGYIGVLEFENGISNITNENSDVIIIARLYGSGESTAIAARDYKVLWYVNDELKTGSSDTIKDYYYLKVSNSQITDNAIIRAEFKGKSDELLYTAFTSVDDLTDPEYMYIQYNGANGQSATLRKGEEVTFDIWVGKMDNPNTISNYIDFKIKLLDSNGSVYTGNLDGIQNDTDGDGWRTLNTGTTVFGNKASITITYDIATQLGKSLTGIIMATELNMDIGGGLTPQ